MTEETKKRRGRKAKSKNPLSSKTAWTVKELQMWISVASTIQGDDFVPDVDQWEFIRDAIFKLQAEPRVRQQPVHQPMHQPMHPGMAMQPPQGPVDPVTGMPPLLQAQDPLPPEANLSLAQLQARSAAGGISNARDPVTGDKMADTGGYV